MRSLTSRQTPSVRKKQPREGTETGELAVSIHPVDDARRKIADQLATFIASPLLHEVLDSDNGLLVDLPQEGF